MRKIFALVLLLNVVPVLPKSNEIFLAKKEAIVKDACHFNTQPNAKFDQQKSWAYIVS